MDQTAIHKFFEKEDPQKGLDDKNKSAKKQRKKRRESSTEKSKTPAKQSDTESA